MRCVRPVHLKGKTALVMERDAEQVGSSYVVAQFDDVGTGYGYGWWLFRRNQFVRASKPSKGWQRHVRKVKATRL